MHVSMYVHGMRRTMHLHLYMVWAARCIYVCTWYETHDAPMYVHGVRLTMHLCMSMVWGACGENFLLTPVSCTPDPNCLRLFLERLPLPVTRVQVSHFPLLFTYLVVCLCLFCIFSFSRLKQFSKILLYVYTCMCMCAHMPWCECRGQRTTCGSQFCLLTTLGP